MRIKAKIWTMAYIRCCSSEGVPAVIVRRGQDDGGAIFIKINSLDGDIALYGPAPASLGASRDDRLWVLCMGEGKVKEADAESYLLRQAEFDPDIWIIEVEDREGRHFLGASLT